MGDTWDVVVTTIRYEFSDIKDVGEFTQIAVRMLMAVVLGGLIGFERESRGTSAGLRTHMLVCLGAALFVIVPLQGGMAVQDLSRVLQGIIAGIGFLGAGAIIKLRDEHAIRGLTTAASIWLTSAVGIAAGMGREATALFTTVMALVILACLRGISHAPRKKRERAQAARRRKVQGRTRLYPVKETGADR